MIEWIYKNEVFDSIDCFEPTAVGFVYLITNLTNNKKYIGKKLLYFSKTKYIKNKKKRIKIESDWKDYYGSNQELQKDVELLGKENFKREILHICYSKGECNYLEAKEQFLREVLENNDYYNGQIQCRINKNHIKKLNQNNIM